VAGNTENLDEGDPRGREVRCECGKLLARLVEEGVEVECRRCKRTKIFPLSGDAMEEEAP
jgi:phage FluMu protein Com